MSTTDLWLTQAQLVTPHEVVRGAVHIAGGRIAALRRTAPRGATTVGLRGGYLAPGFIDLHVWGDPQVVSRKEARHGTTAFLTALGPETPQRLLASVGARQAQPQGGGAACVGIHLEGPFLNPARRGALSQRGMRCPALPELRRLAHIAGQRLKLVTIAPELPGALDVIHWCRRHGVVASLGHSEADAGTALRAVAAGARAVTHVFNGMPAFHHRAPSLLDVALTDARVTTMVIADGVHLSPMALRLLVRAKGPDRVALVTDSLRHQRWEVEARGGAYYVPAPRRQAGQRGTRDGVLAGSQLTMIRAVRNVMTFGELSLAEAVRMATLVPARLVGLARSRGTLEVGKRADLVGFDRNFQVLATIVGGRIVYQGSSS